MKDLIFIFITSLLLLACKKDEEYPFEQSPYIEFQELSYSEDEESFSKILELQFIVWDKEGDIGFKDYEVGYPYHLYNIIIDSNNEPVRFSNEIEPPFYIAPMNLIFDGSTSRYVGQFDLKNKTLYSGEIIRDEEFSCDKQILLNDQFGSPYDTLFGQENEFFSNLDITIYDEEGNEFDFRSYFNSSSCTIGNFDGRLLDISGIDIFSPLEGNPFSVARRDEYSWFVKYEMNSSVWSLVFLDEQRELQFQINDQGLNQSNIETTGLVTLEEITKE